MLVLLEFIYLLLRVSACEIGTSVQIFVVFDLVIFNACENRNGAFRARRLKILGGLRQHLAVRQVKTFRDTKMTPFPDGCLRGVAE